MKKHFLITFLVLANFLTYGQNKTKDLKIGNVFTISLPDYMTRTVGINSVATLQYKSALKDVYGLVIEDVKEELILAELNYTSINDFYTDFINDYLKGEKKRTLGEVSYKSIGEINFAESDISYYDKEVKGEIYYLVGIIETKTSFYKVLSWCSIEYKEQFKQDFQKILYSFKN